MYKLVLYSLQILTAFSILCGFLGFLPFSGFHLIFSALVITIVCYGTNYVLAKLFQVTTNVESSSITSYILFLILAPIATFSDLWTVVTICIVAMASKYIIAIHKKHIFNPAAIALVVIGLFGSGVAIWWVATPIMLPLVLICGLLIVKKVCRFELFFTFIFSSILSIFAFSFLRGAGFSLVEVLTAWPILYFGTIMLTEPTTTPPQKSMQIIYGALVGGLFGLSFHFGPLYSSPELALILGNLFVYIVSPKIKLNLILKEKNQLVPDVYEFVFLSDKKISFEAGQYLEWTFGHTPSDNRGNRRYFTIASSPTESDIRLGLKFYSSPSTFKKSLLSLAVGGKIGASQLAGDFILPKDKTKKLVWIAGGIGITPFRSQTKFLLDTGDKRDIVLLYANKNGTSIAYKDFLDSSSVAVGMRNVYVVNDLQDTDSSSDLKAGSIDEKMIISEVPDYRERYFYISGPHAMVSAFENILKKMGIHNDHIKVDFFPGFV